MFHRFTHHPSGASDRWTCNTRQRHKALQLGHAAEANAAEPPAPSSRTAPLHAGLIFALSPACIWRKLLSGESHTAGQWFIVKPDMRRRPAMLIVRCFLRNALLLSGFVQNGNGSFRRALRASTHHTNTTLGAAGSGQVRSDPPDEHISRQPDCRICQGSPNYQGHCWSASIVRLHGTASPQSMAWCHLASLAAWLPPIRQVPRAA